MREWLSGRALPCQGKCREFESRLPLQLKTTLIGVVFCYFSNFVVLDKLFVPHDFVEQFLALFVPQFEVDFVVHDFVTVALSLCGATELVEFDIELVEFVILEFDILELEFVMLELFELVIELIFFFLPNIISPFM